jgi:hypothetical protein
MLTDPGSCHTGHHRPEFATAPTYILTSAASSDGLILSLSLLRIFPPQVAILEPGRFGPQVEWELAPAKS